MNPLKKLAGQTAIYGLPSILGRVLNYFLVPLHTGVFETAQFGTITEMYAYVAFLVVTLTYGMETAFFRFESQEGANKKRVYTTAVYSLFVTTAVFIIAAVFFAQPIATALKYPSHKEYVVWFAIIVGLDALISVPLAKLRSQGKATRFASITLVGILIHVGLNLFFLLYCANAYKSGDTNWLVDTFYDPNIGVGYVFISNLAASIVRFILLTPSFLQARYGLDLQVLRKMLRYSLPLLFVGLAGIVNEMIDRILLKWMLYETKGEKETMSIVGTYGAFYKISIAISLFVQAFRYAAEPFFFAQEKEKDSKEMYAKIMRYFVIVASVIFLAVMLYVDVFRLFIRGEGYWNGNGPDVIPILLMAQIFLGIYYNLSIWYKLTHKTIIGAYISIGGALLTIALNVALIPTMLYMGSAWATLICYAIMMIVSWYIGQRHFPVPYQIGKVFLYLGLSFSLYVGTEYLHFDSDVMKYVFNSLVMLAFLAFIWYNEKPKKVVT